MWNNVYECNLDAQGHQKGFHFSEYYWNRLISGLLTGKENKCKNTYVKEKYVYLCLCFYFVFYLDQECGKLILQQKKKKNHTGALEAL